MDHLSQTMSGLGFADVPKLPGTHPEINPYDIYRSHIAELIAPIAGVDVPIAFRSLNWPATMDKGDLVLPVPALRLKGKKPAELAEELGAKFPESPLIEKPVVAGTFLQFFFKPLPLASVVLPSILKNGTQYGFNPFGGLKDPSDPSKGKKLALVEFSSPNIAKPFHAGHLRSTIIGGFLSNLYEGAGWKVVRMNYLGDWGKQYGVLAVGYGRFGNEQELLNNPIGHLYEVYVKVSAIAAEEAEQAKQKKEQIALLQKEGKDVSTLESELKDIEENGVDEQARKYFKRMVDGEEEAVSLWRKFRDLSITRYKETYARLNIHYDVYDGESQVKDESMEKAARTMEEKGVSENSEGAVIVDLAKHSKKLGKAVVTKKDGTSLYLTRDIGAILERDEKYSFDKLIYVVASQQDLHFQQLFKIVELIGRKDIAERCRHINFGMVLGMSTRKGTARFLSDILRDVGDHMHNVMRKNEDKYEQVEDPAATADTLGISAVMVQDYTGKRINNYNFDMDRMCSFEGDTGPYLQYAHARLCSIIRKVNMPESELTTADFSVLSEKHAVNLVRQLALWPEQFLQTVKTEEPITVLAYLFKMTHALSASYDHLQVVGSAPELLKARLALYTCARQVLSNGMRLLGLNPVQRM